MSVWRFLANAVWRNADVLTRIIQTVAVTIPFLIILAVGAAGGEWSRDLWPWWAWASLTFGLIVLAMVWGVFRRAYELECNLLPKVDFVFTNHSLSNRVARVALRARGNAEIEDLRVVLIDYRHELKQHTETPTTVVEELLVESKSGERIVSLNQGETYYYELAEARVGGMELAPYSSAPIVVSRLPVFVKVRISGKAMSTQAQMYCLDLDENKELRFRMV